MSQESVWVRARNGALYKDPVLAFPEGFICFDPVEKPELVIWLPLEEPEAPPPCNIVDVLYRVLGGNDVSPTFIAGSLLHTQHAQRSFPGSDPPAWAPARAYSFTITRRIPTPTDHGGEERYPRRCAGAVIDFPANVCDVHELEIG